MTEWDDATDSARTLRTRALGAVILEQVRITATNDTASTALLLSAVARKGIAALPWSDDASALRTRIEFARSMQPDAWPDVTPATLASTLESWLLPFIPGARRLADIRPEHVSDALRSLLSWEQQRTLDTFAPTHITVPTGSRIPLDYSDPASPVLAVRLQEMFGVTEHPRAAVQPLLVTLLSPAGRPLAVTAELLTLTTSKQGPKPKPAIRAKSNDSTNQSKRAS